MTFVFPILLGGLALIGIPVLLHLIFRQKPRRLQFPAFRFLVKRHRTNLRKLQLRHILLLALRVLLIAAICLALARPKLSFTDLNISMDRPVAAIFIIDTSYSMEYAGSDKLTRLDEAKKRALELLDELPADSRVMVLDSAETVTSRSNWQPANQARSRITNLALQYNNAPLTQGVLAAYRMFRDAARDSEDLLRNAPRFIYVFSDRMRACWDPGQQQLVNDAHDQVPPLLESLHDLRDDVPSIIGDLTELRKMLPPPTGRDYPEQALIAALEQLRGQIPSLQRDELANDTELARTIQTVRRGCREILAVVQQTEPKKADPSADFRTQLIGRLESLSRHVQGAYGIFIDIGAEAPVDLALGDVQLPRHSNGQEQQIFPADRNILVRVPVTATGKAYDNEVVCQVAGNTFKQVVSAKAGDSTFAVFELDPEKLRLAPGFHQVDIRLSATDLLPFNNTRFVTFGIRAPQRVLVVTDDAEKATTFTRAVAANGFQVEVKQATDVVKNISELASFDALYLFELADADAGLWQALDQYVGNGGRVGIFPAGADLKVEDWNSPVAQKLLPGKFETIVTVPPPAKNTRDETPAGLMWDYDDEAIYQHPLIRPFGEWRNNKGIDFILRPHRVYRYWNIVPDPKAKDVQPLIRYAEKSAHPAILERQFAGSGGRVLLFTTRMDSKKEWSNYLDFDSSIYVVLTGLSTRYLAGELEEPKLNFQSGRDMPTVSLPPSARFRDYVVRGPVFERIAGGEGTLRLEKADKPGNYIVEGLKSAADSGKEVARFSVNALNAESDLTRAPAAEIEYVLGPRAVTTVERRANIRSVLSGHFSEPLELFPFLMVLLLVVLALENLLANKFYRKESTPETPA